MKRMPVITSAQFFIFALCGALVWVAGNVPSALAQTTTDYQILYQTNILETTPHLL